MRAAMGDGANVHDDDDDDDDDDAGKDTVWISGHARMGDRGRRRSVCGVRRSVVTPDARGRCRHRSSSPVVVVTGSSPIDDDDGDDDGLDSTPSIRVAIVVDVVCLCEG